MRLLPVFALLLLVQLGMGQGSINSFTLINADTDQPVAGFDPFTNGSVINLGVLPTTNLNVRANVIGAPGSVVFGYDSNPSFATENVAPFSLAGDNNGNYNAWTPTLGSHTITGTPYATANGGGASGASIVISFDVINDPQGNQAPQANAGPDRLLILPDNSVTLNGSVSDPNGDISSIEWIQTSGPSTVLSGTNTENLSVSGLMEGSYEFQMTVVDSSGLSDSDNAVVRVYPAGSGSGILSGDLKKWHKVTILFPGPSADEMDNAPNPFLDYRLLVSFTHPASGKTLDIPGFFAGDGSGESSGNIWQVNFAPEEAGEWQYVASFRSGSEVAINLDPLAGNADSFNGATGSFQIADLDANAPGFYKWGRLAYQETGSTSARHYLKFLDGGYWIKGGADSPENFLGYADFDNTTKSSSGKGVLHAYSPHVSDWQNGDPTWNADKGKGIIGALNYLSEQHVNSIYFLPMNIGGDGKDTHPYASTAINHDGNVNNDNLHFDLSKLQQWEQVLTHAQEKGIHLHFVLTEAEAPNKRELDDTELGVERKLFYREMIARFGHHLSLQWNISEEYDLGLNLGSQKVKDFAQYIKEVDPYDHPITVHQAGNPDNTWQPFVGDSRFSLTSFQYAGSIAGRGSEIEEWRDRTAQAGRPIPIHMDELRSLDVNAQNADEQRKDILWPTYLSGGGGIEWYVAGGDQGIEDFRDQEPMWKYTWYARKFIQEYLPFWEMEPDDDLLSGESNNRGQVFAKSGEIYGVYLEVANNTGNLTLPNGTYQLDWYNPRSGEFAGSAVQLNGGGNVALGSVPSNPSEDWVALVQNVNLVSIEGNELTLPESFMLKQNYPNPFNPQTRIEYQLNKDATVELGVYDINGKLVNTLVSGRQQAGDYQVDFEAGKLSSGIYFYTLRIGSASQTRKMILMR